MSKTALLSSVSSNKLANLRVVLGMLKLTGDFRSESSLGDP